jgi:acrylyl-CoA reductase (NADPH)
LDAASADRLQVPARRSKQDTMNSHEFACYLVEKSSEGVVSGAVRRRPLADLPEGDVLVRVSHSSLNYKDALAATGLPGVVRNFPHVPGIDAAGTVAQSASPDFSPGQPVLVTGYELGAPRWGGWAEYVRVPAGWIVPLPLSLSPREAMVYGTAGFTAAQSVLALEHNGVAPGSGEVVVTGASGGVGSIAVALLAKLGYTVVAVSGKPAAHDLLKRLGAAKIVGREEVRDTSDRPLLTARWAGAIDTAGGATLSTLLRSIRNEGCVAACGLVDSGELPITVYPFILRGVTLAGIGSAGCPMPRRLEVWRRLAGPWKLSLPGELVTTIGLPEVDEYVPRILAGQIVGRTVIDVSAGAAR